jgi:hypothetical protein
MGSIVDTIFMSLAKGCPLGLLRPALGQSEALVGRVAVHIWFGTWYQQTQIVSNWIAQLEQYPLHATQ